MTAGHHKLTSAQKAWVIQEYCVTYLLLVVATYVYIFCKRNSGKKLMQLTRWQLPGSMLPRFETEAPRSRNIWEYSMTIMKTRLCDHGVLKHMPRLVVCFCLLAY